ncbi:ribose ABC transporter substrate-binding protein RbsB [Alkalibacterium iburiense]|uniref:Ribose ABC transporter substrate-binding protein RbsB n=1 Tax=Alkalibacterium iburiense TaxID=290589 RepID=A0ABN0XAC9_9LACT
MKKVLGLVSILVMFVLSACGAATLEGDQTGDNGEVEEKSPEEITIGLSISTLNNPFFGELQSGVIEAAEENGSTVRSVDAQDDTATQVNGVDDLIQQGVDILLINPVDSDAITPAIESANSAGIPVITIDRSSEGGDVLTFIASDNVEGGEMAAEFIIEMVGEDARVVQLEGVPGASATNERGEGFSNVADERLNVLESQSANFNRSEGLTVMENIIQSNSDIDAVFAQNDEMALGALEALESAGMTDVIVVGFDGNDDALEEIEAGRLNATVAQQPDEMGRIAVEAVYDYFSGEEVESEIAAPLELITNE